ncbi:transmembrane protein 220 isoform X6 [Podarcis muralis]
MCAPEVDRAPLSTGGAGEGRVRERAMEAAAASLPGLKRESPPPPPPPPSAGASSRVWRLSNLVMAVFFGLAGAVQVGDGAALGVGGGREKCARSSLAVCGWAKVNDPDPGLWITILCGGVCQIYIQLLVLWVLPSWGIPCLLMLRKASCMRKKAEKLTSDTSYGSYLVC